MADYYAHYIMAVQERDEARAARNHIEAERDALRAALEFYADESRYSFPCTGPQYAPIQDDNGAIARRALSVPSPETP